MNRFLACLAILLLGAMPASAQPAVCEDPEAACILDAAWGAALLLPEETRARLEPAFLEIAHLSLNAQVLAKWEARFDRKAEHSKTYPDYGWATAEPILASRGVDGLIDLARQRAAPVSVGRADVLLAAGKHFRDTDPQNADRLNQVLFDLMRTASKFEKPVLAHAAAELAMIRCDADTLSRAISITESPNSLRYAFWRARIDGTSVGLVNRIRNIGSIDDTREIRRILDGYRAILEHGYCPVSKSEIGG